MNTRVFYRTTDIFSGLLGKELTLTLNQNGMESFTDVKKDIVVGLSQNAIRKVVGSTYTCGHPVDMSKAHIRTAEVRCDECSMDWAYRSLEHELQHHAFQSNPRMAGTVAHKLARKFFPTKNKSKAAAEIGLIINALEDIRCNSLWEELYPGSAAKIWAKWKEIVNRTIADVKSGEPSDRVDGVDYQIFLSYFGMVPKPELFDLVTLVPLIRKKSPKDVYKLTAHIVEKYQAYIDKRLDPTPPDPTTKQNNQQNSSSSAVHSSIKTNRTTTSKMKADDNGELLEQKTIDGSTPFGDFENQLPAREKKVLQVLDAAGNDVSSLGKKSNEVAEDMKAILDTLRSAVVPSIQTTVSQLERDTGYTIKQYYEAGGDPLPPLTDDLVAKAAFLRQAIQRIQSRRNYRLEEEGPEIDFEAYLQLKGLGEGQQYFRVEQSSFGFTYALLLDKSGSMVGNKFNGVMRATTLLREVLGPQPYVKGRFFWFWANHRTAHVVETDGTVHPTGGWGCTPLRIASRVLFDSLELEETSGSAKLAVILTDGEPTDTKDPEVIRAEIDAARHKGIKVFTIVISRSMDTYYEKMFGPSQFIRRADSTTESVEKAIEDVVLTGFLAYLRRRHG